MNLQSDTWSPYPNPCRNLEYHPQTSSTSQTKTSCVPQHPDLNVLISQGYDRFYPVSPICSSYDTPKSKDKLAPIGDLQSQENLEKPCLPGVRQLFKNVAAFEIHALGNPIPRLDSFDADDTHEYTSPRHLDSIESIHPRETRGLDAWPPTQSQPVCQAKDTRIKLSKSSCELLRNDCKLSLDTQEVCPPFQYENGIEVSGFQSWSPRTYDRLGDLVVNNKIDQYQACYEYQSSRNSLDVQRKSNMDLRAGFLDTRRHGRPVRPTRKGIRRMQMRMPPTYFTGCQTREILHGKLDNSDIPCAPDKKEWNETSKIERAITFEEGLYKGDSNYSVAVDFGSVCDRIVEILVRLNTRFARANVERWKDLVRRRTWLMDCFTYYDANVHYTFLDGIKVYGDNSNLDPSTAPGCNNMMSVRLSEEEMAVEEIMFDVLDQAARMMEARITCHQFLSPLTVEHRIFTAHSNSLHLLAAIQRFQPHLHEMSHFGEQNKNLIPQLFLDVVTLAFDTVGAGGLMIEVTATANAMEMVLSLMKPFYDGFQRKDSQYGKLQERLARIKSVVISDTTCWRMAESIGPSIDIRQDVMYGVPDAMFCNALTAARL